MNSRSRLFLTLVPLAGLLIAGCNKSEPENTPPPKTSRAAPVMGPPVTVPPMEDPSAAGGPTAAELKNADQMRAMELREAELQQQLEEEKLARLEAEMAKEEALLDKERVAWSAEQQAPGVAVIPGVNDGTEAIQPVLDNSAYISSGGGSCDYQGFYDDLAPYGTWYDSPVYGYCWQPTVCTTDAYWSPYTCGSWNACDAGWSWCSDEPFGWACYHYGRWAKCRDRGWIWVPGDQWAPAWVCWRKNDTHIGWCPLPPETCYTRNGTWGPSVDTDCGIHPSCYVFMPAKYFDKPVRNHCESPAFGQHIFGSTKNITNVICRPGRVQCEGPEYDWVTRATRRSIPRYTLAWDTRRDDRSRPAHRVEKDRLHFFAPKVDAPWNSTLRPRTRVSRLENPDFVRAETGVPDKMTARFKTERAERDKAAAATTDKTARRILDRQQKLAEMQKSRETITRDVEQRAEAIKSKLAAGPLRPEAPLSRPPRAVPATAPHQTGGDVVAKTNVPVVTGNTGRPAISSNKEVAVTPEIPSPSANREAPVDPKRQAAATRDQSDNSRAGSRSAQLAERRQRTEQARAEAAAAQPANAAAVEARQRQAEADVRNETAARAAMEQKRRQDQETAAATAAADARQRQVEAATRNEATAREELDRKQSARAAMEQKRRQDQETAAAEARQRQAEVAAAAAQRQQQQQAETRKAALAERQNQVDARRAALAEQQRQAAAERAVVEQQRQVAETREAAVRERTRQQEDARAAIADQQRRQAEAEARAEQAARQREELERQRAAMEQQRRQAEAHAQAERAEAARREAMERQQQAEQQRRQQQEEQQRRNEEQAARQREAAEQQQRRNDEQARRASEDNARRQAEDNARREASERARQDNDHKRGR